MVSSNEEENNTMRKKKHRVDDWKLNGGSSLEGATIVC
jgi:hypothetical protein